MERMSDPNVEAADFYRLMLRENYHYATILDGYTRSAQLKEARQEQREHVVELIDCQIRALKDARAFMRAGLSVLPVDADEDTTGQK